MRSAKVSGCCQWLSFGMEHTVSLDVVWFFELADGVWVRPPPRQQRLLLCTVWDVFLVVLVRKLGLFLRADALDPSFGDLLVG